MTQRRSAFLPVVGSFGRVESPADPLPVRTLRVLLGAAVVVSACVPHRDGAAPGRDGSRTVSVVGALIAPGKANRRTWDAGGLVDEATIQDLAAAMATTGNPYVAAAGVVGAVAAGLASPTESPDIVGRAELWIDGARVSTKALSVQEDTFTPQWSSVAWRSVEIDRARIRVVLEDDDLAINDPVGIAEIDSGALNAAATVGHVHSVRVDEQTSAQILFLNISVM